MSKSSKIYSPTFRVRKAYWTAVKVMWSYMSLSLRSKMMGQQYYQKRIGALHIKNAQCVKLAILELKGLFIKVGQLLSILSNFLPEAFHRPLADLQDQIPTRPYSEIEERIIKEFGVQPQALFTTFDQVPIASASIGQVHRASLIDGTDVVVKVQHSYIEQIAEVDLRIMKRLTAICARYYKVESINHAYTQVEKMIHQELDYLQEVKNMRVISDNLASMEGISIPTVHSDYCTSRVLTSTYNSGVKISDVDTLCTWQVDRQELGQRLVRVYCKMVFEDGMYHADPHPGNILIQQDGDIVLLDFGAIGQLKSETRDGFLQLIEAAAKNNTEKIIEALQRLGFITNERKDEVVAEKIIVAFRDFLQNEVEFDGLSFKDLKVNFFKTSLFSLFQDLGFRQVGGAMQVPKEYVLLNRMVTLLLGICQTLDPQINPLEEVRPYFRRFIVGESGDVIKLARTFFQRSASHLITIPSDLSEVLNKARRGRLDFTINGQNERTKLMYVLAHQFMFLLITLVGLISLWMLRDAGNIQLDQCITGATLIAGFLWVRSVITGRKIYKEL